MECKWSQAPLGELISYISKGIVPKYTDDIVGSTIVLGQRCVRNQRVDYTQARFHDQKTKPFKPEKTVVLGDILINATGVGSAGRVAQVTVSPQQNCVTDGHVITLRAKGINPFYLGYFLKSKQAMLEQMAEGSTGQTEMNRSRLQNEIVVTFPQDNAAQTAIAQFGLSVDRKIAINNQINGYLAAICETISSELCQDIDGELKELCSLVTDKSDCKNAILETYVSTESLLPGKSGRQFAGSVPTTGKVSVFKSGDTLVSNIRPYFKKIWYASEDGTCSSDVLVFRAFNPDEAPYLNACLRQDRFFDYVMRGAKGTKMPRGDKKQIMGFPIARSCDAGDLTVLSGLVKQMTRNEIESHRLTELRDVLLPKPMSGEIDVSRVDLTQLNSHLT